MNHNDIQLKLQDYLENLLTDNDKKQVETHLQECSACRTELEQYRVLFTDLDTLPEMEPPADIVRNVMRQITPVPIKISIREQIRIWLPRIGIAYAVGLILVMLLGYTGYSYYQQTTFSQEKYTTILSSTLVGAAGYFIEFTKWFADVWNTTTGLIQTLIPLFKTSIMVETVLLLAGLFYWYLRKQKTTHHIFA